MNINTSFADILAQSRKANLKPNSNKMVSHSGKILKFILSLAFLNNFLQIDNDLHKSYFCLTLITSQILKPSQEKRVAKSGLPESLKLYYMKE